MTANSYERHSGDKGAFEELIFESVPSTPANDDVQVSVGADTMNPDALRKARLWLSLVFLVGAAIGAVFGYSFGYRSYAATLTSQQQPMSEAERRAKCLADMTKEVDHLTPEQTAKMDDIIKNANASIKRIREKSEADVDVVREQARNETRALLTDAQKPKFEAMVQRMDAERTKMQQQMGK